MKILIVIPFVGPVYGGPPKCVAELAQALGMKGVSVDVVTTHINGATDLDVPLQTWIADSGYRIQYFPYWKTGASKIGLDLTKYPISFSLTQWLFQHVTDYELVHTNTIFSYPVLVTHWACQYHQIPYMATAHGMLNPSALAYKANKKRFYFSLVEKPALQQASALQALNSIEAKHIDALDLNVPAYVVPNGIHRQDFAALPEPELFYQAFPQTRHKTLILFLARIDPLKGLDLLAAAFAKVQTLFPDIHLIVAGSDNTGFLPTAQEFFEKAGCLNAVTFTGMLTGATKYAALAAASIYVSPSYLEGFSMSILEGMASGLPCVITSACNFPEAAAAQAAAVVEVDAGEIADALMQCLQDPHAAKEMGDRARQFIFEQYTWDHVATKMIEVYSRITHKTSVSSLQSIAPKL
jgi:glycosyltransferase involved in cell wall biosynthesis